MRSLTTEGLSPVKVLPTSTTNKSSDASNHKERDKRCEIFQKSQNDVTKKVISILENPWEYVEYWEGSLCWSADARILYEEYDPVQDEVSLPYNLDPSDDISVDSNHKLISAYAYDLMKNMT